MSDQNSDPKEESKVFDGEIVDHLPNEIPGTSTMEEPEDPSQRALTLTRTKYYAKKLLTGLTVQQVVDMVREQIQLSVLLLNEQMLKFIEELEIAKDQVEREHVQGRIEKVLAHTATLAKEKNALLQAVGYDPLAIAEGADGQPIAGMAKKTKISKDQFESMFGNQLNPFATMTEAESTGKTIVETLVDPDIREKLHSTIKEAADSARKNLGRVDDPNRVN